MSRRLQALLGTLVLFGCAAEGGTGEEVAPSGEGGSTGGCVTDAECGQGRRCAAAQCEAIVPEACRIEVDPACPDGTLCTIDVEVLCPGDGCQPERSCHAPIGDRGGGYACTTNDQCRSGACAGGLCVQLCGDDGDCDGISCVTIALPRGGEVKACAATDALGVPDLATTRCGGDTDCGEGQVCRRVIGDPYDPASISRCAPIDPARSPARTPCPYGGSPRRAEETGSPAAIEADAACQSGDCFATCGVSANDLCIQARCAAPCDTNDDCPEREVCSVVPYAVLPHARPYFTCQAPPRGCFAERDCCLSEDAGGCFQSWEVERTHCAPALFQGRFVTSCVFPEGRSPPGMACATDADCVNGICLPDAPGGVQACAFVCDELGPATACPEMTGVVGAACRGVERSVEGVTLAVPVCRAP